MDRLLIGYVMVLGPVQVGMAVSLVFGPTPSRDDVGAALAVAIALGLTTLWLFYGRTARELARLSPRWLFWSDVLPLTLIGLLVVCRMPCVQEAWQGFRRSHLERPEPKPLELGGWTIREIPATPATPVGSSGSRFRVVLKVLLREWLILQVRVQWSTPTWAYGLTLVVILCFRPTGRN
jgi:hypothetical protein